MQHLNLLCNDDIGFILIAKLHVDAVRDLNIQARGGTMTEEDFDIIQAHGGTMKVYDGTSTRDIDLDAVDIQTTYVRIRTGPQTDNFTVNCMLDCLVANMKRRV